ncbi:uncharacterized protein [Musca autumnalis]|uniref:uncharacterized protein n=1 Tax=Musca autumnalis TaxID=221902 RepID=UPI003CFAC6F8
MGKVNTIHFSRRQKVLDIAVNRTAINQTSAIKYLGLTISAGGSAKVHIDDTTATVDQVNNFLMILGGCNFGLSPAKAINFFKAFARAKLEYGASALSNLTKTSQNKIKVCINKYLRRALGLLRSTPVPILYHLAAELPPQYRFELSTAKELVTNTKLLPNRTTSYAVVYDKFKDVIDNVASTKVITSIPKKLVTQTDFFMGLAKKKADANQIIIQQLAQEKVNHLLESGFDVFFTDGSVIGETSCAAFLHINSDSIQSFYTNKKLSSMTAEILAFLQTAIFAQNQGLTRIAILTDSLSGIQAVMSKQHRNFLIDEFIEITNTAFINTEIHFVPGHTNIGPNERVDQAAKNAAIDGTCLEIKWPIKDAINHIKNSIWKDWSNEYKSIAEQGNSHFFKIFGETNKTPWYKKTNLHPDDQKVMNRILSNHTFSNSTLAKMKVVESGDCEVCNVEDSISHILFECTKHSTTRTKFNTFSEILTVEDFMVKHKWEHLYDLVKFIKEINVKI